MINMENFGKLKSKILQTLTESYESRNMNQLKTIFKTIKENKDFKEMYIFYDDIEKMYIDDVESSKLFVEEMSAMLKKKSKSISGISKKLSTVLGKVETEKNDLYESLDLLIEDEKLSNINKKLAAKKFIVEHLTRKKDTQTEESTELINNEYLLYAVLSNNFNAVYDNSLSESEKTELKEILSMNDDEIVTEVNILKEDILSKVSKLITENSKDESAKKTLEDVENETNIMQPTKFNYYKLKKLKNDLN